MKIVILSSHTPSLFWFRMEMMQCFIDCGCEVFALGNEPEATWKEQFAEKGVAYRQIYVERNSTNPLRDLKTLRSIYSALKSIRPDKIFTYQAKTVIYGGIAANRLGIREVYPLIAGIGSVFLKEDWKTKLVRKVMVLEYRLGMRKSPTVFFQNRDDEQVFRDNHIIQKQKTVLLHGSGVNLNRFQVLPFPEQFGFLCISRLIRDKGVYEYLEACKKVKKEHPEVRCLLVGPYDSNPSSIKPEELREYIDCGAVEYFGEQTDVRPYLAQCNVFVLPSYREGTPKANLEAMACGRAVITTDTTGCRETVVDGENGYLVPIKDVDELYEKMRCFILNPDLALKMGADGRKKAETTFDVELVNQCICESMKLKTLQLSKS